MKENIKFIGILAGLFCIFVFGVTGCNSSMNSEPNLITGLRTIKPTQVTAEVSTELATRDVEEEPLPHPTRQTTTGIYMLDRAVAVILSNNVEARLNLVNTTTAGCTKQLAMGGPPKCEDGQSEGEAVTYFPILGPGEGAHIDPESIQNVLDFEVESLYAIYQRNDKLVIDLDFPPGDFGLIFSGGKDKGVEHILVHLNADGQIIRLDFMAWSPESILEQEAGRILVPPPGELPAAAGWPQSKPTPTPGPGGSTGQILHFEVKSDVERPGPGDTVYLSWETVGGPVDICASYGGWTNYECFTASPSGEQAYILRTEDPVADHWVDFEIHVRDAFSGDFQSIQVPIKCHYNWFAEVGSQWCPYSPADQFVGDSFYQEFENGLAMSDGNFVRLIFDDPPESCRYYSLGPEVNLETQLPEAPNGYFTPTGTIAALWLGDFKGAEDLREKLGWAVSPPKSFLAQSQCERTPNGLGKCYASLPDGQVFIPEGIPGIPELDGISFVEGSCAKVD